MHLRLSEGHTEKIMVKHSTPAVGKMGAFSKENLRITLLYTLCYHMHETYNPLEYSSLD